MRRKGRRKAAQKRAIRKRENNFLVSREILQGKVFKRGYGYGKVK